MVDRLDLALPAWAEGVLVIGDVHGQDQLFRAAIALAAAERRFVVSLGDLVDRGPDNAACIRLVLDLLRREAGLFLRGNHDDKLYRALKGNPVTIDGDLALTLEQLDSAPDSEALKKGFSDAYRAAPFLVRLGTCIMVHGAFAPAMLATRTFNSGLKALALFGETKAHGTGPEPVRTYGWVERIPAGTTVVIGHHPISDEKVLVRTNGRGGSVVHLDCGAGKGRGLGTLRLASDGEVLNAVRFDRCGRELRGKEAPFVAVDEEAAAD